MSVGQSNSILNRSERELKMRNAFFVRVRLCSYGFCYKTFTAQKNRVFLKTRGAGWLSPLFSGLCSELNAACAELNWCLR